MRFRSTLCAVAAAIVVSLSGAQAVEACTTFRTVYTSRLEVYFCTLRGWDASYCYYSCVQIPLITLDF